MKRESARAFAPASVGHVAVGFDILGFSIEGVGDEVTAKVDTSVDKNERPVIIEKIEGVVTDLPLSPDKNTAAVAVKHLLKAAGLPFAVRLVIHKGIPISAGMGGSAASAVAAVVATNELLEKPFHKSDLLAFALQGEAIASGSLHADNVAPSLMGGLKLVIGDDEVLDLPVSNKIFCVLVHPSLKIETKKAREVLSKNIPLETHVKQSALLAGFIHSCHKNDLKLMKKCLSDVVIEPQRGALIPGFDKAKEAAIRAGAIGFSISGAGPSVFAWADQLEIAEQIRSQVSAIFNSLNLDPESWISPISQKGASVITENLQ